MDKLKNIMPPATGKRMKKHVKKSNEIILLGHITHTKCILTNGLFLRIAHSVVCVSASRHMGELRKIKMPLECRLVLA